MAAPTIVGTPTATVYAAPLANTPGSGSDFVLCMGADQPAAVLRTYTATWDGNAMTLVTANPWNTALLPFGDLALFRYATPGTGSKNFAMAGGNTMQGKVACTLDGVDAGTPLDTPAINSGTTGTSATVTVVTDTNALALAWVYVKANRTLSAGADETIVIQYAEDNVTVALISKAGGASVNFAPTWTTNAEWGIIGVGVNGSASGSGGPLVTPGRLVGPGVLVGGVLVRS